MKEGRAVEGRRLVASLPPPFADDPYLRLFYEALAAQGFELCPDRDFGPRWFFRNRGRVFAFHIHWLHMFYNVEGVRAPVKFLWFVLRTALLRLAGFRIFFTLHNFESHERRHPVLDRWANRWMCRIADRVFVHGETALAEARERYPHAKWAMLPYFSSAVSYPDTMSRDEARRRLGLAAGDRVYLAFGKVRIYKGLDLLVRAFRGVAEGHDRLVIAGRPETSEIAAELEELAGGDSRIRTELSFIPQDEVQAYMNAADFAVLPYRHILTTGSAGIALGFGVPMIASRTGSIADLVPPDGVLFFDPDRPGALEEALIASRSMDTAAARRANLARSRELGWHLIGAEAARHYRAVLAGH